MLYPSIDPIAFSIGPIAIRWYALAYIAGITLGWAYVLKLQATAKLWRTTCPFSKDNVDDVLLWATFGIVLGGRLGYVLFYNLEYFTANPEQIFQLWNGGMAFHGGLLGVIIGIYAFCRLKKIPFFALMDTVAAAAPIGLFFGRIANFINGELWGRVTESSLGMIFPGTDGTPRHPSQLYQAGLEGFLICIVLTLAIWKFSALKTNGRVSSLFLMLYGCARIIGELFREPDPQLGFLYEGLTMGMLLSIPMILLGIYLYFKTSKSNAH